MDLKYVVTQHMEYKDISHTNFHMMGIERILDNMDSNWMDQPNIEDQAIQYS